MVLRACAARCHMPEWMFTSDASNASYSCHDEKTQLLTKRGWITYKDIREDDEAGTMNPDTQEFEWQKIQAIHIHDYKGEMIKLKGHHNLDVLVTPNHRMYTTRTQNRRINGKMVRVGVKPW